MRKEEGMGYSDGRKQVRRILKNNRTSAENQTASESVIWQTSMTLI